MSKRVDIIRVDEGDFVEYRIRISKYAWADANFDRMDRRLLAECEGVDATESDVILGIETVVRRIEQTSGVTA